MDTSSNNTSTSASATATATPGTSAASGAARVIPGGHRHRGQRAVTMLLNLVVLALSVILIVWISVDTFTGVEPMDDTGNMHFQFWMCVFFLADFFVGLFYADRRSRYFWHRIIFFILSVPYLNILGWMGITLSPDAMYFIRFIPLARGALAISIVIDYLSSNAVASMFMSYLSIMVLLCYFCSLIFYAREHGVNPQVSDYWLALWWSGMNLSTVGCYINPVTVAGKIVAVVLPMCGMIIFPLFTVYLTDWVTDAMKKNHARDPHL